MSGIVLDRDETFGNLPVAAMQAMYYKITGKTETLTARYASSYIITRDDIRQLHVKLSQSAAQYTIVGQSCGVDVFHKDDQRLKFTSFERFLTYDKSLTSRVVSIVYHFDMLITLPSELPEANNIHQRYRVGLRIRTDDVSEHELPAFITLPNIPMYSEIEYINYAVARTCQGVINEWVSGLSRQDRGWLATTIDKNSFVFVISMMTSLLISGMYGAFNLGILYSGEMPESKATAFIVLFTLGGLILSLAVSGFISFQIMDSLSKLARKTQILLNRGDEIHRDAALKRRALNRLIVSVCFITLILGVAVNIFSSWLFQHL